MVSQTPPNQYSIQTQVQLLGTFTEQATGLPFDPAGVQLYVKDPSGAETLYVYPTGITKVSVGVYSYTLTPELSGEWRYKWQGTGTGAVTSRDISFYVWPSKLIPG